MYKFNPREIFSTVSKAVMKSTSLMLASNHPIGTVVANEAIDLGVNVLMGQFPLPREDIHKKIHTWCRDILLPGNEEYLEIICAAAEICLEDLDLLEVSFDAAGMAEDLSKHYIQRYQTQFDGTDIHYLKRNLPAVLEKTILELAMQSEQDPAFQVAWKALIHQRIDFLEREQLSNTERLVDHEQRIAGQERLIWKRLSTVAELSEDYRRKWNEPLFLDDTVKLKQVYQLPYIKNDLMDSENDFMDNENDLIDMDSQLQGVIDSSDMLVILGHPGSGKSTLITYLLNNCNIPKDQTVRVHRFTGFENINWNGNPENLPQLLINDMGLDIDNLSNLFLILDGLDEIDMLEGHDTFLDCLYKQWVRRSTTFRFSLIITCRTNRILDPDMLMADYVVLSPLTGQQIQQFARTYWKKAGMPANLKMVSLFRELEKHKHSLRDILGIPLILYITLALGITVTDGVSLSDVYDQIFSLNSANSIYLRSKYDRSHPVTSAEAKKIHDFSKGIAEKIWELNPMEATVEQSIYEPLATKLAGSGKGRLRKLLIGQYFMEGQHSSQLLFVHRSLYEYFTALSIFDNIKALTSTNRSPKQLYAKLKNRGKTPELTALANLIGVQCLFEYPDIHGYLLNMLRREPLKNANWWKSLFSLFTQWGLADAVTGRSKSGAIGIQEELNRFYNLICLVREELRILGSPAPFHLGNEDNTPIYFRIPSNSIKDLSYLDLQKIELPGGNFESGDFSYSNMNGAHLMGTSFRGAKLVGTQLRSAIMCHTNLSSANLREADLSEANLQGADLSGADLQDADLSGANLQDANLEKANLKNANLTGAVMENVTFTDAILFQADLSNVSLRGAILRNINFFKAELYGTDLAHADMTCSILREANLRKADLSHAKLDHVDMSGAVLYSVNMQYASLSEAFLCSVDLKKVNLQNADLCGADLRKAQLLHVNLQETDLSNVDLQSATLRHVDLREAEMIHVNFNGASIEKADMTLGSIDKALYSDTDFCMWEITWDEPIQLKKDLLHCVEEEEPQPWDLDIMRFDFYQEVRQIL